jgi:hypothetical protein
LTAPMERPRTSCVWAIQPAAMTGRTAKVAAAGSTARNWPRPETKRPKNRGLLRASALVSWVARKCSFHETMKQIRATGHSGHDEQQDDANDLAEGAGSVDPARLDDLEGHFCEEGTHHPDGDGQVDRRVDAASTQMLSRPPMFLRITYSGSITAPTGVKRVEMKNEREPSTAFTRLRFSAYAAGIASRTAMRVAVVAAMTEFRR